MLAVLAMVATALQISKFLPQVALFFLFASIGLGEGLGQIALGVTLGAAILGSLCERRLGPDALAAFKLEPTRPLLAFTLWALVTMAFSPFGWPAGADGSKLYNLLGLVAVPWALSLSPPKTSERLLWTLIGALAVASIYGILQYRFGVHWGAKLFGAPAYRWQVRDPSVPDRFTAGGFFFHRLRFAHVLVVGLVILVFELLDDLRSKGRRRWLDLFLGALLLTALALTFARAAFFAAIVGVVVGLWLSLGRQWKQVALAALLAAMVLGSIGVLLPAVRQRALSVVDKDSYAERLFIWQRATEMVSDHPWLGIGYGNYSRVCGSYYDRVDPSFPMRSAAHNQFLTILTEGGPVALALWLWLNASLLVALWRRRKTQALGLGLLAASWVLSMIHDPFVHHPSTAIAFSALFGLCLFDWNRVRAAPEMQAKPRAALAMASHD